MNALLDQLDLNNTFFMEFAIVAILFIILSNLFFRPFLKLFEMRRKRTVEDRETAERLLAQATAKMDEYKRLFAEERLAAKVEYDRVLADAKMQEANIIAAARDEAKKITQSAIDSVNQQRDSLIQQLQGDVESVAQTISERLLSRKV